MVKIGSHVSFSDKGLLNAANEAITYGSSTFMIYTGAPQNTRSKPIEEQYIEEGKEVMAKQASMRSSCMRRTLLIWAPTRTDTFDLLYVSFRRKFAGPITIGVQQYRASSGCLHR